LITNFTFIFSFLSILFSLAALIIGCVALSFVIGLKNSTHQVVFKPVDETKEMDPFFPEVEEKAEDLLGENPNKRIKKEESFADLSDPNVTSNNW
jgi:hypothetical protein